MELVKVICSWFLNILFMVDVNFFYELKDISCLKEFDDY